MSKSVCNLLKKITDIKKLKAYEYLHRAMTGQIMVYSYPGLLIGSRDTETMIETEIETYGPPR